MLLLRIYESSSIHDVLLFYQLEVFYIRDVEAIFLGLVFPVFKIQFEY